MIQPQDIDGRRIQFLGATGFAGTSIDLSVVQKNIVLRRDGNFGPSYYMPLFVYFRRLSTGGGAVPAATMTAGSFAVPTDWQGSSALSGNGPDTVKTGVAGSILPYAVGTIFTVSITVGAAGTCDIEVYGVTG